jgi:perosamine synthetase
MHAIPFFRPNIEQAEIDEVVDTLKNGWLTTGPKTKKFEAEFALYLKQKHAVAVNSCTAALHLALEAIGLEAGQTVVVPTMTFAATAEVVRYFNAKPLLVDCRLSDFNLDVADATRRIDQAIAAGERIAAILPVHYGGQIGDVAGVTALAERYQIPVIEDAAHCCPAYYRAHEQDPWQPVGTGAAISCFSFYANKTITTGEGGMACTQVDRFAERMRIMSLHGISRDAWKRFTADGTWYYEIIAPGFKYNLTDVASSLGLHQVRKADRLHQQRTAWADVYTRTLQDMEELILPTVQPNRIHSWHLYPIRLRLERLNIDRAQFMTELKQRGIGASVHWMPLHMHPYYRQKYGYQPEDLSQAASLYPQLVSLPLYPDLTESDVEYVCRSLRQIVTDHLK